MGKHAGGLPEFPILLIHFELQSYPKVGMLRELTDYSLSEAAGDASSSYNGSLCVLCFRIPLLKNSAATTAQVSAWADMPPEPQQ